MRPTKFTPEAAAEFVQATALGATRLIAGRCANWEESTVYKYLAIGETARRKAQSGGKLTAGEKRHMEFVEEVERAEGQAARGALATLIRAMQNGDWRPAMWLLEHRWPTEYSKRTQVEVTGADGGPVDVEVSATRILEALAELREAAPVSRQVVRALGNGQAS